MKLINKYRRISIKNRSNLERCSTDLAITLHKMNMAAVQGRFFAFRPCLKDETIRFLEKEGFKVVLSADEIYYLISWEK